jgi:hypothetical protein
MPYKDKATKKAYMDGYHKKYYAKNRLEIIRKQTEGVRQEGRDLRNALYHRVHNFRLKVKVLAEYGGRCVCCGEDDARFLGIDHTNGGGGESRRNGGRSGTGLYMQLQREGYPGGYQVLCHNCNQAKADYTECPHHLSVDPVTSLINQYMIAYFRGMREKNKRKPRIAGMRPA